MRSFLRKCRGALGLGLTWSVAWAAIFALLGVLIGLVDPDSIDPGEEPFRVAWIGAVFGFISGTVFGAVLSLAEGRKMLRGLSVWRAALWGALGTAAFPLLTGVDDRLVFFVCPHRRRPRRNVRRGGEEGRPAFAGRRAGWVATGRLTPINPGPRCDRGAPGRVR